MNCSYAPGQRGRGGRLPGLVAEKAGFTMEGLLRQAVRTDGGRRDCWVGSLVKDDMP
jgi:hypothetical protein